MGSVLRAVPRAVPGVTLPDQHSPGVGLVYSHPPRVSRKPGQPSTARLGRALNTYDCQSVCWAVRVSCEQGEVPAPGAAVRVSDKDITPGPHGRKQGDKSSSHNGSIDNKTESDEGLRDGVSAKRRSRHLCEGLGDSAVQAGGGG